jgi:hypothetical protein
LAACALMTASVSHGKQYALIASGLGGEPEYEQRFQKQAKDLAAAARHASQDADVVLLTGAQATRAAIAAALADFASKAGETDRVLVTLIGHGSYDGEDYRYNVPGPDVTATDLRQWLARLKSREQLVVLATSSSGAAMTKLQSDRRIVITATKSGGERNATRFAEYWAQALSASEADRDKNEWVTVKEAYEYAVRKVADSFKESASLATEHARIEGLRTESFPLGRLGALAEMPSDPQLVELFAQRVQLEDRFEAVKSRKQGMDPDAYYTELEQALVALAKTQRGIDARQSALLREDEQ